MDWDLLVIDEAHEGIDTTKTDIAFDQIKRSHTLHLSGTPFKALASGRFGEDQIFNWTYEDEQTARDQWSDGSQDNPYASLPTLNLLTYQLSRMVADRLAEGVAVDEDEANVDYTFDLAEFFRTKDNGFFEYEAEVIKFLDTLTTNEKYPFSTPELRDEIRHSFWLLNRVASAKALERLLKKHEVFKDYTIVLAAGDGRSDQRRESRRDQRRRDIGGQVPRQGPGSDQEGRGGRRQDDHALGRSAHHGCHGPGVDGGHHAVQHLLARALHAGGVPRAEPPHVRPQRQHGASEEERLHLRLRPRAHTDHLRRVRQQPRPTPAHRQWRTPREHPAAAELLPRPRRRLRGPDDRARRLPGAHLPAGLQGTRGRAARVPLQPPVRERRRHLPLQRARQGDPRQAAHRQAGQGHDRAVPGAALPAARHRQGRERQDRRRDRHQPEGRRVRQACLVDRVDPARRCEHTRAHRGDEDRRGRHRAGAHQAHRASGVLRAHREAGRARHQGDRGQGEGRGRARLCRAQDRPAAPRRRSRGGGHRGRSASRRDQACRGRSGVPGEHPEHRRGDDGQDRPRGRDPRGDQEGPEAGRQVDGRRSQPPARVRSHHSDVPHGLRRPGHPPRQLRRLHPRRRVRGDHRDHRGGVPLPARWPGRHRGGWHRHHDPRPVRRGRVRPGHPGVPRQEGRARRLLR